MHVCMYVCMYVRNLFLLLSVDLEQHHVRMYVCM
jgi:hypothetical protein